MKRLGPRTEPCGTTREIVILLAVPSIETEYDRDEREERNQLWAMDEIPNQVDSRVSSIDWSRVSKAHIGQGGIDRKLVDVQSHWSDGHEVTEG